MSLIFREIVLKYLDYIFEEGVWGPPQIIYSSKIWRVKLSFKSLSEYILVGLDTLRMTTGSHPVSLQIHSLGRDFWILSF